MAKVVVLDKGEELFKMVSLFIESEFETEVESSESFEKSHLINSSLFIAGQKAGLPDKIIMELTDIFAWDVDFVLDIRQGDRFSVIFEELYKDNKKVKSGKILLPHLPKC